MIVPPAPILALIFTAQAVEVAVLVMPFSKPDAVRTRFSVIPRMVIRAIVVVVPRMRRASACQKRRKHCSAQQHGPDIFLDSQHFAILLWILSSSSGSCADHAAMNVESPGDLRVSRCQLFIKHGERAQVAICSNGLSEDLAGSRTHLGLRRFSGLFGVVAFAVYRGHFCSHASQVRT
jgi:hypothetical protein